MLKRLFFEEKGEDIVEYALLVALIAIAVIATGVFGNLVGAIEGTFDDIVTNLGG